MPHNHIPLYDLTLHRVSGRSDESLIYGAEDAWAYEIESTDGHVLLQLRNLPTAVIALYAAYHGGPESNDESRQDILIVPKNGLEALISMLKSLHISDGKARLKVGHSPARAITECSWDSLTLDTAIVSLVRDDFEMFFERERWFRDMGLPFRRGYLLHGPPGCGKSTAIRAMITSRGLTAYTMRFFAPRVDDDDLDHLFTSAAQNAPSTCGNATLVISSS
jgi:SpoVK/Ycf46/Vps4 family AAA+-type ATPase